MEEMGKVIEKPEEEPRGDVEVVQASENDHTSPYSPSRHICYTNPSQNFLGDTRQNLNDTFDDRLSAQNQSMKMTDDEALPQCIEQGGNEMQDPIEEHSYIYYEPTHSYEVNHSYLAPSLEPIPENQVWSTSEEPRSTAVEDDRILGSEAAEFYGTDQSELLGQQTSSLPAILQSFTLESHAGDKCADKWTHANENLEDSVINIPSVSHLDAETIKGENVDKSITDAATEAISDVCSNQDPNLAEPFNSSIPCATGVATYIGNGAIFNFHQAHLKSAIPNFPALDHSGTFHWKTLSEKGGLRLPRNLTHAEVSSARFYRRESFDGNGDLEDEGHRLHAEEENKSTAVKKSILKSHPDVDRGYAWVVALCVLVTFAILSGLLFTCSLYYTEMLKEFGESRSYTAWIGSLVNGFFLLGSIGSSALIQKFSCRVATIIGSLVMTLGYIASAFAPSLQTVFVTFGIITASGMNLVFSSAILVLAQYFDKRHCLATTIAMIGNGLGVLILSQVMEQVIMAYGWRLSFIVCAAISLHLCVVGALFFPLPPSALQQQDPGHKAADDDLHDGARSGSDDELSGSDDEDRHGGSRRLEKKPKSPRRHNNLYYRRGLLDKSFSSLVLSPQAGYLSHSLASLEQRSPSVLTYGPRHHHADCEAGGDERMCRRRRSRHRQLQDGDLKRNESSRSRDSSFLPAFFKRSQLSFSSKLSSAQISVAGIRSSQHSRVSLKDSRLDLMFHGLKSNPHSFSLRCPTGSQLEETEQLCAKLDDLLEEEKSSSDDGSKEKLNRTNQKACNMQIALGKSEGKQKICSKVAINSSRLEPDEGDGEGAHPGSPSPHHSINVRKADEKKASFLISGGESDEDDDDSSCASDVESRHGDHGSKFMKFLRKLQSLRVTHCSVGISLDPIFRNPSVWCFAFAYFFCLLGTLTIYVIFADFAEYVGVGSYASMAMSAAGIGDIIGRFGGGMLAVGQVGNPIVLYATAMLVSALLLCSYLLINSGGMFIAATAVYGVMFGAQNMYFAVTPNMLFGRQCLANVFGLTVFLGGIGALVGSPLAGFLIDISGGYLTVLLSEVACCVVGSFLMFVCYFRMRSQTKNEQMRIEIRRDSKDLSSPDTQLQKIIDIDERQPRDSLTPRETHKSSFASRDSSLHRPTCPSVVSGHVMSNCSSRSSVADDDVHIKASATVGCHTRNLADSRGSLTSLPTRASLHPSLRSHSRRSINSLKRTSTCDSILHRAPIHYSVPINKMREGGRRFTVSNPRQYSQKKKSPSLYEEVLGRSCALRNSECSSDHDLTSVSQQKI